MPQQPQIHDDLNPTLANAPAVMLSGRYLSNDSPGGISNHFDVAKSSVLYRFCDTNPFKRTVRSRVLTSNHWLAVNVVTNRSCSPVVKFSNTGLVQGPNSSARKQQNPVPEFVIDTDPTGDVAG
jgi:hypothetical protein